MSGRITPTRTGASPKAFALLGRLSRPHATTSAKAAACKTASERRNTARGVDRSRSVERGEKDVYMITSPDGVMFVASGEVRVRASY
ncbi:MAG: hypothetical protein IPK33_17245 [Gemmatimonadetes bacterium]|nr:hypothetical protein [Gemmatimonadota bacterium]